MSDKEVKIKITGDISDLQKKLKSIEDSLNNLGKNGFGNNKSVNSYIDDISKAKKETDELGDSVNDISDSLRKAGKNSGFDEVATDIGKIDKKIETVTDNAKDFSKSISNIDTKQMDTLDKQLTNVNDNVGKAKENFEGMSKIADGFSFDSSFFSDANKKLEALSKKANGEDIKSGGLLSEAVGGLVTGSVAGKMLANTMEGVTSGIRDVVDELNRIDDNTSLSDKVAMFDKFGKELDEARASAEELSKEIKGLEEDQTKLNTALNDARETIKATDGNEDRIAEIRRNIEALEDEIKSYEKLEKAINDLNSSTFRNEDYTRYMSGDIDDELRKLQKARDEYKGDTTSKNFLFPETELEKYIKQVEKFNKSYKKFFGQVSDEWGNTADLDFGLNKYSLDELQEFIDGFDDMIDQYEKEIERYNNQAKEVKTANKNTAKAWEELDDLTKMLYGNDRYYYESSSNSGNVQISDASLIDIKRKKAELAELKNMKDFINEQIDKYTKELDIDLNLGTNWSEQDRAYLEKLRQDLAEYKEELKELENISDNSGRAEAIEKEAKLTKELTDLTSDLNKKREELAKIEDDIRTGSATEDEYVSKLNEQMDAYTKLNQKMKDLFATEELGIFTQKRIAQAVDDAARAMKMMIVNAKDLDGYDLDFSSAEIELHQLNEIIEEHMKDVKLLSYDNLIDDINRLGKSVEDKTNKLNELKEANKEMDSQSRRTASSMELESQAIREFAENAGFALKYYKEFAGTDREIQIVGNYKSLESILKPEKLREYNDAVREYLNLINETGGQISKRFLDDEGKFDVNKYIADYERFGKPINQLTASFKALRQQVLEYLKVQDEIEDIEKNMAVTKMYKEEAEAAQKAAKAKFEAAEAADKAAKKAKEQAQSEEEVTKATHESWQAARELYQARQELNEATRDVEKYTQELADAQKDLTDAQERAAKTEREGIADKAQAVKMINEQAEALRRLGAAVDGIELDEIRNIDKTLGTKLKGLFSDGLPKSFSEIGEYIKSAFSELNDLDFGNFGSLLKDAGMGLAKKIFGALPAEAKIAAAAIAAVTVALNKLYESGKRQFFEGLSNAVNKLQPVINAIQSLGREAITAFESITGTNVDLSSLMELGPNFEYQMQKVGAIAGSNSEQLAELTKAAEHLGGTTQYSASQVGEAFEYMAMAGYNTEEMLESIGGVLNLSIASGTDLAKTSDIVTDYMTAMGMEASQTSDFVDKLAATVTSANTNVEQFGNAMKQVASQAGALGVSMTDVSTAIGLQANAGVKGSKAGTALKNILGNMANPTENQAKALKKLGFAADETGSYFKTTADGAVDLEATIKQLMTSTEKMTRTQKAAALVQFAGREALPGLMALLSQGAEGWDELSDTIENSTAKIQYWNECMSLAGKSGSDATKLIDNMKKVFAETEVEASALSLSAEDLSHAIALLGDDGKVNTKNVQDLLDVIESMNTATGKAEEKWRALDGGLNDAVNTGYDYDATIAKLTADTTGLSQATKDQIEEQLKGVDTYKEANAILGKYGLTAERTSFESLSFAEKLGYLRNNLKDCTDEYVRQELANLGLADSFDEVKEILKMTDTEFDLYAQNLENVKGMAERLAGAMDEVTKASLLNLASAIENVCIAAFNKLKPVLKGVTDEVNKFFDVWHNFGENEFTFDGLEKALDALAHGGKFKNSSGEDVIIQGIKSQEGKIKQAIVDLFASVNRFINDGSLQSLLDMGTSIVQSICKGIIEAKDNGSLDEAIDGAIKKICNWIETNGPIIEEAGVIILDSLTDGIKNNEDIITSAMNKLCSIMTSWASSSGDLKAAAGLFAEQFVGFAVENMWIKFKSWIKEKFTAFGELFSGPFTSFGTGAMGLGMNLWNNIMEGIFGVDPAGSAMAWLKEKFSGFHPIQAIKDWFTGEAYADSGEEGTLINGQPSNEKKSNSKKTTKKLEQVDVATLINIDEKELSEVESALVRLQTAAEEAANTVRKDFVSMANIARNQMLNISNIIRNQAINWANIIRNQAKNARDGFTSQMISMASVARTQLVNVSNIIRNQSLSWYNVINNQAKNARDAFTRQFMSMAAVARTQMANCLSAVNDYMSQIKTATSQQMTMNLKVNRAVTTTDVTKSAAQGLATTMSNIARSGASLIAPQAVAIGGSIAGGNGRTDNGLGNTNALQLSIPLTVDGREIARATASYNQEELSKMAKRNNRRRGE